MFISSTATISASLEKIKSECEEVKIMVPARQNSETSELSASTEADQESDLGTVSPLDSALASPEESPTHGPISRTVGHQGLSHLELEDLDLLPTKEVSAEFDEHHMRKPNFKITSHDGNFFFTTIKNPLIFRCELNSVDWAIKFRLIYCTVIMLPTFWWRL